MGGMLGCCAMRDRVALKTYADILQNTGHHLYRYMHALPMLVSPVLDAACGTGYGSFLFAERGHTVTAVDISSEATDFGKKWWANGNIHWITADLTTAPWGWERFKTIVSFETLEHLDDPVLALKQFAECLDKGGRLICSVPNEEQYPFNPQDFEGEQYPHKRHYTPAEFNELLESNGFEVIHRGTQLSKQEPVVVNGSGGRFLIYTAMKR